MYMESRQLEIGKSMHVMAIHLYKIVYREKNAFTFKKSEG